MKRATIDDLHEVVKILERAIPGMRRSRKRHGGPSVALRRDIARIRNWWSPNIAGFGIGRKRCEQEGVELKKLVIRFYLHRKLHLSRVPNSKIIPTKIPLEHLDVEVGTDVRQLHGLPRLHFDLAAGEEVGHFSGESGTLGVFIHRVGGSSDYLLSCAHILAPPPGPRTSDPIESPVDADSTRALNQVGELDDYFRLSSSNVNQADAAIARVDTGVNGSNNIDGLGVPSSLLTSPENLVGKTVFQRGAVTARVVSGKIREMGCCVPFLFRGGTYRIGNLVRYEIESRPGDSGAAVLDENNRVVGIHVGAEDSSRSAYFSPMHIIVDQFGIDL